MVALPRQKPPANFQLVICFAIRLLIFSHEEGGRGNSEYSLQGAEHILWPLAPKAHVSLQE